MLIQVEPFNLRSVVRAEFLAAMISPSVTFRPGWTVESSKRGHHAVGGDGVPAGTVAPVDYGSSKMDGEALDSRATGGGAAIGVRWFAVSGRGDAGHQAITDALLAPPVVNDLITDLQVRSDLRDGTARLQQVQHPTAKLRG